ncbi:6035_t:CDS:2, partial [Gigaspora rosea]
KLIAENEYHFEQFRRPRRAPGDGGIDYFGRHREFTILIQIKNYI